MNKIQLVFDKVLSPATDILSRVIRERTDVSVVQRKGDFKIALSTDPSLQSGAFLIGDSAGGLQIVGGGISGLMAGIGKFLRNSQYREEVFIPGEWRGSECPALPVRGIYFASHFGNWYVNAPLAEVERYVEELSLLGINHLMVWFDMHHYDSISDPAAQEMIIRLRSVFTVASRLGMTVVLGTLSNEAYRTSPENLRADWTAGHDGYFHPPGDHYHVEVCPSKSGGPEYIMEVARERYKVFESAGVGAVVLWPYDQGGCTCSKCTPWGSNGHQRISEQLAQMYRKMNPQMKIILSTWYFDHFVKGEWEGLSEALHGKSGWADYLMAGDSGDEFPEYPLKKGAPGSLPILDFPEISMYKCWPWGGFGASPMPSRLQRMWNSYGHAVSGGFPYSEGIFEDVNKAIMAGFYWSPEKPVRETMKEYAGFEFSPEVADDICEAAYLMERGLARKVERDNKNSWRIIIGDTSGICDAHRLLEAADRRMPERLRRSWRWRLFLLRGRCDKELLGNDLKINEQCEKIFEELTKTYRTNADSTNTVSPPTRQRRDLTRKNWNIS